MELFKTALKIALALSKSEKRYVFIGMLRWKTLYSINRKSMEWFWVNGRWRTSMKSTAIWVCRVFWTYCTNPTITVTLRHRKALHDVLPLRRSCQLRMCMKRQSWKCQNSLKHFSIAYDQNELVSFQDHSSRFVKSDVSNTRVYCIGSDALNGSHICRAQLIPNSVEKKECGWPPLARSLLGLVVKVLRSWFLGHGFESRLKFMWKIWLRTVWIIIQSSWIAMLFHEFRIGKIKS